jgi:glucokinase
LSNRSDSSGSIETVLNETNRQSGAGRTWLAPPSSSSAFVCGIDLGGTQTRLRLADSEGATLGDARTSTTELGGPERFIAWVVESVARLGAARQIASVGMAAPGPLDPKRGVLINPPNLPGWGDVPITALLGEALGCLAHLENDANLAALGEWQAGAGLGTNDLVYVTWSTGVGGGLILDGRLFSGHHGTAGEIGHTILDPNGPLDKCGQRGCVEAFCGGGMLERQTGKNARRLFQDAAAGDRDAAKVVHRATTYMGNALINLTNLFDPEIIVMGGGITESWSQIEPVLIEVLHGSPFIEPARRPQLRKAHLGDWAGLVGAIAWARSHLRLDSQPIDALTRRG